MTLLSDVQIGSQAPTLLHQPSGGRSTAGVEAIELAESAGLILDPWQQDILRGGLAELPGGQWAAREVCEVVPRQNGKGGVLMARQLAGLYVLRERLQLHTAHEFKTTYEHFLGLKDLIEGCPDLERQVRIIRTGTGDQSIELKRGPRLRFIARSRTSGRGIPATVIYLDEAFALTTAMMGALLFTLRAQPAPQLWYASSAPMYDSEFLHGLLKRAERDDEDRLYVAAWESPPTVTFDDPDVWLRVNPAIGYRISLDTVLAEWRTLRGTPEGVAEFARECLGIREGGDGEAGVIPYDVWHGLEDEKSRPASMSFGLAVSPDAAWASFSVAGPRRDGLVHVETVRREMGTGWIVPYAVELFGRHQVPLRLLPSSAAGALLKALAAARVPVVEVASREYAQACVDVLEAVKNRGVRHLGQESMNRSVAAAGKSVEDKGLWVWARPGAVDITPLEAATLAWTGAIGPVFKPRIHVLTKEAT